MKFISAKKEGDIIMRHTDGRLYMSANHRLNEVRYLDITVRYNLGIKKLTPYDLKTLMMRGEQ